MFLSADEEISGINHVKVSECSQFKIFVFKYRWSTCKITKDYLAVCIVVSACICVYVHVYVYMHLYTNILVPCQTFEKV